MERLETTERKQQNRQEFMQLYRHGKEMAERLICVADRVMAGETESTACMEENVEKHWIRRFVRSDISIDKSHGPDKGTVRVGRDDWMNWQDRFLTYLTGEECYAPKDFDQVYEACVSRACTEQEREVLRLWMQEEMTLREIGGKIGKSQERIRQINARVMRKLRHPSYRLPLMYGWEYLEIMESIHTAQAEYDKAQLAKIQEANENRKDAVRKLKEKREQIDKELEALANGSQLTDFISEVLISDMGLSTRAQNALNRHRVRDKTGNTVWLAPIRTLGDLCKLSRDELKGIDNLGTGTVKEIEDVLFQQYGLRLSNKEKK